MGVCFPEWTSCCCFLSYRVGVFVCVLGSSGNLRIGKGLVLSCGWY